MKRTIFIIFNTVMFMFSVFSQASNAVDVTINTLSNNNTVKSSYRVDKLSKNAKLISISFTNIGNETQYIKDIRVKVNNLPALGEQSKFMYASYDMGDGVIKICGYNDIQAITETVMLVKKSEKQYFKTGILSWEIFRAEISFSKEDGISVYADGENKPIKPGKTIQFEKIVVETGNDWQNLLYDYGKQIAMVQDIKPKGIKQLKGWSTYDYYGGNFTDKEIALNISKLKALKTDANLIQIDGGWWGFRGDYLNSRNDIEGGMPGIAKLISENGFMPGIHLDGFRADKGSEVFKAHPDWFLKDQNGETFFREKIKPTKTEHTIYFDFSNPDACEYMKNTLKTIREKWGFKYFKIDFLWYGLNKDIFKVQQKLGLKEIKAFDSSMTSLERTRAGLKAMREGIGEACFLGCSAAFGSTFGLVDALRTGPDINPMYDAFQNRCLHNAGSFYLNNTVVQNDADYLVLRNKDDEEAHRAWSVGRKFGGDITLNEAKMWADYVSLFGGIKISSDNLDVLREERKNLIKKSFSLKTCTRFIPIDFWDKAKDKHDAYNIILGSNADGVYLALFNWSNEELGIKFAKMPTEGISIVNTDEKPEFSAEKNIFDIKLKARTSVIFKLNEKADFDKVRKEIKYEFSK